MFGPMLTAKEEVKSELSQRRPQPTGIDATYYDLGYGSLTLTRLDPSPLAEQLADVLAKRGQSLRLDSGAHLAVCDKYFLTHLVFQHRDGQTFDYTAARMLPVQDSTGQPTSELVGIAYGTGQAVITPAGIGIFGGWSTMSWTLDVTASEDRVEERAETWFAKVEMP